MAQAKPAKRKAARGKNNSLLWLGGLGLGLFFLARGGKAEAAASSDGAFGPGHVSLPDEFNYRDDYGFVLGPSIPGGSATPIDPSAFVPASGGGAAPPPSQSSGPSIFDEWFAADPTPAPEPQPAPTSSSTPQGPVVEPEPLPQQYEAPPSSGPHYGTRPIPLPPPCEGYTYQRNPGAPDHFWPNIAFFNGNYWQCVKLTDGNPNANQTSGETAPLRQCRQVKGRFGAFTRCDGPLSLYGQLYTVGGWRYSNKNPSNNQPIPQPAGKPVARRVDGTLVAYSPGMLY